MAGLIISESRSLRREDFNKALVNARLFFAPLLIIYVAFLTNKLQDGVQIIDFVPSNEVLTAGVLYVLSIFTDIIKKWAKESKY